jgi:hypothetical protein
MSWRASGSGDIFRGLFLVSSVNSGMMEERPCLHRVCD